MVVMVVRWHTCYRIYEILEVLGQGSLGHVCRVRKRMEAVGGSANPQFVVQHKGCCFPFIAQWMRWWTHHRPSVFTTSSSDTATDEDDQDDYDTDDGDEHPAGSGRSTLDAASASSEEAPVVVAAAAVESVTTGPSSSSTTTSSSSSSSSRSTTSTNAKRTLLSSASSSTVSGPYNIHIVCPKPMALQQQQQQRPAPCSPAGVARQSQYGLKHNTSSLSSFNPHSIRSSNGTTTAPMAQYALKSIHLNRCCNPAFVEELKNEVEILKELDHPNIVRAIETFDYQHRLYIVLELCRGGGDLYSRDPYPEAVAQSIVHSLCSAVAYLHRRGIVHRDLKYENVMFVNWHSNDIKLIDFGLSQKFVPLPPSPRRRQRHSKKQTAEEEQEAPEPQYMHDPVGTLYTMAPELLSGDYTHQVDVWSLGVIAFMLLSSSLPFYGRTRVKTIQRILKGKYRFLPHARWKTVSRAARDFVQACLCLDPEERPTARQAQKLDWLVQSSRNSHAFSATGPPTLSRTNKDCDNNGMVLSPADNEPHSWHNQLSDGSDSGEDGQVQQQELLLLPKLTDQEVEQMNRIQASILAFAGYSRLKKLALLIVAYKSTSDELGFLNHMFERFDLEHDGEISRSEFVRVMTASFPNTSLTLDDIQTMFHGIDVDGTGTVHYSEFLAATLEAVTVTNDEEDGSVYCGLLDEARLAEAFDRMDCDDSGYITLSNLSQLLGPNVPDHYVQGVLDEVTQQVDGTMTTTATKDQPLNPVSVRPGDSYISYQQFRDLLWSTDQHSCLAKE